MRKGLTANDTVFIVHGRTTLNPRIFLVSRTCSRERRGAASGTLEVANITRVFAQPCPKRLGYSEVHFAFSTVKWPARQPSAPSPERRDEASYLLPPPFFSLCWLPPFAPFPFSSLPCVHALSFATLLLLPDYASSTFSRLLHTIHDVLVSSFQLSVFSRPGSSLLHMFSLSLSLFSLGSLSLPLSLASWVILRNAWETPRISRQAKESKKRDFQRRQPCKFWCLVGEGLWGD